MLNLECIRCNLSGNRCYKDLKDKTLLLDKSSGLIEKTAMKSRTWSVESIEHYKLFEGCLGAVWRW